MSRLKGRLGKGRWAGFGVGKFVGGFNIGVTNSEVVLYTVVFELVSDSLLNKVLS